MEETIINFIIDEFHNSDPNLEIDSSEDLLGAGLVESVGMMVMIQFLEKEYEIKVQPKDMTIENFISVDAMAAYISRTKS